MISSEHHTKLISSTKHDLFCERAKNKHTRFFLSSFAGVSKVSRIQYRAKRFCYHERRHLSIHFHSNSAVIVSCFDYTVTWKGDPGI